MIKFTGKYRLDRGTLFWMGRRFPGITIGQVYGIKQETPIDNKRIKRQMQILHSGIRYFSSIDASPAIPVNFHYEWT